MTAPSERVPQRPAAYCAEPHPLDPLRLCERLSGHWPGSMHGDVEWLMGLPDGHVTAVPGLSRNDQLKLLGNGVVPQQAELALRLLFAVTGGEAAA